MDLSDDFFTGLGDQLAGLNIESQLEEKTKEALRPPPTPVTKKGSSFRVTKKASK